MKFCWSTLMVRNLEESLKFYTDIVGLKLDRTLNAGPGVHISFLGDGETKIELICNDAIKELDLGHDISLGFEVDSVDEMLAFVKEKGIDTQGGIVKPNPHMKFFYILDPNGLKLQFLENIK